MINYTSIQEAYNIPVISKNRSYRKNEDSSSKESFMNDYSPQDDCYYKKEYGVDTKVCKNKQQYIAKFTNPSKNIDQNEKQEQKNNHMKTIPANIENSKFASNSLEVSGYESNKMNKQGESCSPLQAPSYEYPISGECKKDFENVMNLYTSDNTIKNPSYEAFNKDNKNKDIQPYYDEDLEQYFDINNLTDAINYKSSNTSQSYMSNSNKNGYSNDNTSEYRNINNKDDNLLTSEKYNLTQEDKEKAAEALKTLKMIEDKINKNTPKPNIEYSDDSSVKYIKSYKSTAPQSEKSENKNVDNKTTYDNNDIYYNIMNIVLFIFIGIIVILLCDQITEIAIHIGMRRTIRILEPYLIKNMENIHSNNV
jgi:hypothetical protein